jgi:hypothetical protein
MAMISGTGIWLADGALDGVVEQVTVLVQRSFRLQAPRVVQGVQDVGDQAFAGSLAARRNVRKSSLGRNFRSCDGAHHG